MNNINHFDVLGMYVGEQELGNFLKSINVDGPTKIDRDERDVTLVSKEHGIELTFSRERFLDFAFRPYPEGALVLSSIFIHGTSDSTHERFSGVLPMGLTFGMNEGGLIEVLGKPNWTNPIGTLMRWDCEKHCVSARLSKDKGLELLGIQLPNRYTAKTSGKRE